MANVDSRTHQENAQCGVKLCHKCGNKNHFTTCCRTRDRKDSQDRDQHRLTYRDSQNRRESRSRHRRHASEDSEDRSRSRSTTQSAHSIESNSFQEPLQSPWETPQISMRDCIMISMGDLPFKTLMKVLII